MNDSTFTEESRGATAANWQDPPYNRWAFRNVRRLLPTARVHRGMGTLHTFKADRHRLRQRDLMQADLERTWTDSFMMLHRGRIVHEWYAPKVRADGTHIIMSISKSVLSSLIGILVDRGVLDLARPAGYYVPELPTAGYGSVTLSRLLDMRSGVRYSEDYDDPNAEFYDFDAVCGLRPRQRFHPARNMHEYLAMLPLDPTDTGDFRYRSTDSDVLGWIAERSTGLRLDDLLSRELWGPLGTEEDADLLLDPTGAALADGGLCTTLRDLARFAQMQLDGGYFNGHQIVPEAWIAGCCTGDAAAFRRSRYAALFARGAYSRQWWIADPERRVRVALGIHGQMIYLDPGLGVACVKLSSAPLPADFDLLQSSLALCRAMATALT